MNSKSITWGTVIGVLLAALGIIAPIVWDLYKGKAELELQHLSSATLVENRMQLDKLKITYDGKPIRALSKVVFAFVNSGRTAILQEHLKEGVAKGSDANCEIIGQFTDFLISTTLCGANACERAPQQTHMVARVSSTFGYP